MRSKRGAFLKTCWASWFLLLGPFFIAAADTFPPTQVCAPDDNQTCLLLSPEAAQELVRGNNAYNDDVYLRLSRIPGDETGSTLRSIRITATLAASGESIPSFAFQHLVQLQLGHWYLFERSANSPNTADNNPFTPVNDVRQWLSVYWYNGESQIRLDNLFIDANQTLNVSVSNLGQYQIHTANQTTGFRLAPGSPYPQTLTPAGRTNRRAFFFVENSGSDEPKGTIYDFHGAKIRDLRIDGLSPTASTLVWDGHDESGNVVPGGPYFYKISAGRESVTGGLVVAR